MDIVINIIGAICIVIIISVIFRFIGSGFSRALEQFTISKQQEKRNETRN